MAGRDVRVGERTYTLAPFRAFKAVHAGEIIARVSEQVSQLMEEDVAYQRRYAEENTSRLTRGVARLRGYENWPDGEEFVDLPGMPAVEERVANVFPKAFKLARDEVLQLLALIVIPNSDLRKAEADGRVDEALREVGEELFYEAEWGELLELLAAASDQIRDTFESHRETLGKLRGLISRTTQPSGGTDDTAFDHKIRPATVETQTEPSPTSSTPSRERTGGDETTSSSESRSESSVASAS